MPRKVFEILIIISAVIIGFVVFGIYYVLAPDTHIDTTSQVKQIVLDKIPQEYKLESIRSVQRISQFEGEYRPMKWLILTLKEETITDEKDLYKIAEPICKSISQNDADYEGMDINLHTTLQGGVNCAIWGP